MSHLELLSNLTECFTFIIKIALHVFSVELKTVNEMSLLFTYAVCFCVHVF